MGGAGGPGRRPVVPRAHRLGNALRRGRWTNAFEIWNGGLGIPGGVLAGTLVGIVVARRTVPSWRRLGDAVAPAIPVAQAIGRLGNYFNQEVYGRATDLPWGLRVDDEILMAQNPNEKLGATFHPTFLYEGLGNLALAGLIIWGGTKVVLRPGRWFAVYIAGYGLGRLWVESLRIDEATLIAGSPGEHLDVTGDHRRWTAVVVLGRQPDRC
ncbi:MAG: prolipoprotein diacylglyceryl transferase [Microthrixaceae bacterium]|nr:prolipoprotein diacylglyceryl transferase [Microthrixaceae bacterium]